jgi:hypothetical protein
MFHTFRAPDEGSPSSSTLESQDITVTLASDFFPPKPVPPIDFDTTSEAYELDALYAAKHDNVAFLELLLGPYKNSTEDEQLQGLSKDLGKLKSDLHEVNARETYLIEEIEKSRKVLEEDAIIKRLRADYQKHNDVQLEEARGFGDARATSFANGQAVRTRDSEREAYLRDLEIRLNKKTEAYLETPVVKEQIRQEKILLTAKLKSDLKELDSIVAEREGFERIKEEKSMISENIRDARRLVRESVVKKVIESLKENKFSLPERYHGLLQDKRLLLTKLQAVWGAHVDVRTVDTHGNSLMHHAMKRPTLEMVELLLKHDASSTIFLPNREGMRPYEMAIGHGNNVLMALLSNYLVKRTPQNDHPTPAFHDSETLARLKSLELDVLNAGRNIVDDYRQNVLPQRESWWFFFNARLTQQRRELVDELLIHAFPTAQEAQSYYLWEVAVRQGLSRLEPSFFNQSKLRDRLNQNLLDARQLLAEAPHPWQLANQVQSLLAANASVQVQHTQSNSMPPSPASLKLKHENEDLKAKVSQLEANMERLMTLFASQQTSKEDVPMAGQSAASSSSSSQARLTTGYDDLIAPKIVEENDLQAKFEALKRT